MFGSGVVALSGGIAVKQMDESAGDALILTNLGVTGLKAIKQQMRIAQEELPE